MAYGSVSDLLINDSEELQFNDGDCPRCNFNRALYQLNAFGCQDVTIFCWRCGYYDYLALKLDKKGRSLGSEHQTSCPLGFLSAAGELIDLNSEEDIQEKAEWLKAEIAAGKIAGRDTYLARWNESTGEAELVEGKYPW
jgi:hypothetical protein